MTADGSRPGAAARTISGLARAETLLRYSMAWPLFFMRETLAAYDDLLALGLNVILGADWDVGGPDHVSSGGGLRTGGSDPV